MPQLSAGYLLRGESCPLDTRLDLGERGVATGRPVVAERREAAVIGGAEPFHRNESRGLEHSLTNLVWSIDAWIDWRHYAGEHLLVRSPVLSDNA
jgi:hypothetical protein